MDASKSFEFEHLYLYSYTYLPISYVLSLDPLHLFSRPGLPRLAIEYQLDNRARQSWFNTLNSCEACLLWRPREGQYHAGLTPPVEWMAAARLPPAISAAAAERVFNGPEHCHASFAWKLSWTTNAQLPLPDCFLHSRCRGDDIRRVVQSCSIPLHHIHRIGHVLVNTPALKTSEPSGWEDRCPGMVPNRGSPGLTLISTY